MTGAPRGLSARVGCQDGVTLAKESPRCYSDKMIRTVLGMANKVRVVIDKRIEMIMDMVQAVVNKRTRMILAMDKRVHRDDHGYG